MTQHLISTEGWRDISTAPLAVEVDLYGHYDNPFRTSGRIPDCKWQTIGEEYGWFMRGDRGWERLPERWTPTHWMPLPTPPVGEQA